jgi:hypothetical protein
MTDDWFEQLRVNLAPVLAPPRQPKHRYSDDPECAVWLSVYESMKRQPPNVGMKAAKIAAEINLPVDRVVRICLSLERDDWFYRFANREPAETVTWGWRHRWAIGYGRCEEWSTRPKDDPVCCVWGCGKSVWTKIEGLPGLPPLQLCEKHAETWKRQRLYWYDGKLWEDTRRAGRSKPKPDQP